MWEHGKFFNRYYIMQEVYERAVEAVEAGEVHCASSLLIAMLIHSFVIQKYILSLDADPFYDPPETDVIGVAMLYLQPLSYRLDSVCSTPILDYKGQEKGFINAEMLSRMQEALLRD